MENPMPIQYNKRENDTLREGGASMLHFENGVFFKLKKIDSKKIEKNIRQLLLREEKIISTYQSVRDYIVFTDKRIIAVNVQGVVGKKIDYTSIPYTKITTFSVETAGVIDLDSEMEIYFAGLGTMRFEFVGKCDILKIGQIISTYIL